MIRSGETTELSDEHAEQLLELIHIAITEYGGTFGGVTLREFAEDVAMSMDKTTDRADQLRQWIEQILT